MPTTGVFEFDIWDDGAVVVQTTGTSTLDFATWDDGAVILQSISGLLSSDVLSLTLVEIGSIASGSVSLISSNDSCAITLSEMTSILTDGNILILSSDVATLLISNEQFNAAVFSYHEDTILLSAVEFANTTTVITSADIIVQVLLENESIYDFLLQFATDTLSINFDEPSIISVVLVILANDFIDIQSIELGSIITNLVTFDHEITINLAADENFLHAIFIKSDHLDINLDHTITILETASIGNELLHSIHIFRKEVPTLRQQIMQRPWFSFEYTPTQVNRLNVYDTLSLIAHDNVARTINQFIVSSDDITITVDDSAASVIVFEAISASDTLSIDVNEDVSKFTTIKSSDRLRITLYENTSVVPSSDIIALLIEELSFLQQLETVTPSEQLVFTMGEVGYIEMMMHKTDVSNIAILEVASKEVV